MTASQIERHEPPLVAGERPMLDAWLEYHRDTLLMKCVGLTDDQLKTRSAEPSSLSLLGLVRHMTDVERGWFQRGVAQATGPDVAPIYYSEAQPDGDFDNLDDTPVDEVFSRYRAEVDCCRAAAAGVPLDRVVERRGERFSVRWIFTHMVEEYARHNGHADLLRERIDGAVGD